MWRMSSFFSSLADNNRAACAELQPSPGPHMNPVPGHLISVPTEKWPVASVRFSRDTFLKGEDRKKVRSTWRSPWHCITRNGERSWKCRRDLSSRISFLWDKRDFFREQTNTGITVLDVVLSSRQSSGSISAPHVRVDLTKCVRNPKITLFRLIL